ERRAEARLADGPDLTAVCLDDSLRDEEPEPGAFAAGRVIRPEAVEEIRQVLRRNAGPRVGYSEPRHAVARFDCEVDFAAARYELQRIAQQIGQHLLDALAIGVNENGHGV